MYYIPLITQNLASFDLDKTFDLVLSMAEGIS